MQVAKSWLVDFNSPNGQQCTHRACGPASHLNVQAQGVHSPLLPRDIRLCLDPLYLQVAQVAQGCHHHHPCVEQESQLESLEKLW